MALLVDIFGFLSVMLRGLTLSAQAMTLGGIIFLLLVARPFAPQLGATGETILRRCQALTRWSALALALIVSCSVAIQVAVLVGTVDITAGAAAGADFALAGFVVIAAALGTWLACRGQLGAKATGLVVVFAIAMLLGQAVVSHAAARLDDRFPLAAADILHLLGASAWIGGIPCFVVALAASANGNAWRLVGSRFSHISMISVAAVLVGGIVMATVYIGSVDAIYGTAYGVMVSTKVLLLMGLLFLGFMNFRAVERLRRDPSVPILRLRRFAEVEIGIGLTVLFAAASLTSLPPAVDLPTDRASWQEIVERITPHWPSLESPDHGQLAIPELQARYAAVVAASNQASQPQAYVPGSGIVAPRNAEDIAWSEYNHHWSGILVLAIGLLALLERSGYGPWARHWPLLFLVLGGFLLLRSDPETWPLGDVGFLESFRDPEVVQHRIFVVLISAFAFFEWGVRTGRVKSPGAALVFPLITAVGGGLLLTHSHAIANIKEQLLIEITHVPLALCGITAGWARWLELRLEPPANRIAGWIWPLAFVGVGLILLAYRES